MSFRDILNQPLPSKTQRITVESFELFTEDSISHIKTKPDASLGAVDIAVFGGERDKPHFHLFWNGKTGSNMITCCIRFDKNIYFLHPKHEATDIEITNVNGRKELVRILKSKHRLKKPDIPDDCKTVWDLLIFWWNKFSKDTKQMIYLPENLPIPDYTRLHRGTKEEEDTINFKLINECKEKLRNEKTK